MDSCRGCRCSRSAASPSTVMTVWPSACAASIRQERTATPSKIPVQAPHSPCSQPTCVPASRRSCRRKSLSRSRDSTWRRYCAPFTVTVTSWLSELTLCPLVGLDQGTLGQHAREMSLEFFAGVDAAARVDGPLNQLSRLIDLRRADRPAGKRLAGVAGQDRFVASIAQTDPRFGTSPIGVNSHRAGHADEREIAAPTRHLHEASAGARLCDR